MQSSQPMLFNRICKEKGGGDAIAFFVLYEFLVNKPYFLYNIKNRQKLLVIMGK